jgi:dihydrofolate reductase
MTQGIFYGRKSYEMMLKRSNGTNPLVSIPAFVFPNTLPSVYPNTILVSGDLKEQVAPLLHNSDGNYWFFCGADLLRLFLALQLIDEIGMAIHPLLLGDGKPLFSKATVRTSLTLLNVRTYSSGLVYASYRVLKNV